MHATLQRKAVLFQVEEDLKKPEDASQNVPEEMDEEERDEDEEEEVRSWTARGGLKMQTILKNLCKIMQIRLPFTYF